MSKETYKPTLKEIVGKMYSSTKKAVSMDACKDAFDGFTLGFKTFLYGAHRLPEAVSSENMEDLLSPHPMSVPDYAGLVIGYGVGCFTTSIEIGSLVYATIQGYPEALLFPVITNTASGIKVIYDKTKERLIEQHENNL